MPLTIPAIDDRRYEDLLKEAIARIPVHNPEWTNFNRSDPGITLIELFAFLTENLLYRANLIPERNRRKFLSLLGIPLQPAAPARGLVAFSNVRGPLETTTLNADLEVRAGQVPFRTRRGVDVLPVEARVYYKRPVPLTADQEAVYRELYASFLIPSGGSGPPSPAAYETVLLDGIAPDGVDLASGTVDGSLWVALVARPNEDLRNVRSAIEGKTLSLGLVPVVTDAARTLPPAGTGGSETDTHLEFEMPDVPPGGALPDEPSARVARYRARDARSDANVLLEPGIVEIGLPPAEGLELWELDPLEAGVDQFPPAIEDAKLAARVVTWLRVRAPSGQAARFLWAGINATTVVQRARVASEALPSGTGQPDQVARLSQAPVLDGSVELLVSVPVASPPASPVAALPERWAEIDDLMAAGPEVPAQDPRQPPGAAPVSTGPTNVFALDAEAGLLRFGDGTHGRRPPTGATLRATYDFSVGGAGNVAAGAIKSGPALPPGFGVSNPVRTWGGSDAETVAAGEKQVARYLQHRDRLVNTEDFLTITRRTPGVEIGRVEVLAAYDPSLRGTAPGAVTLMVIPRNDARDPAAPSPDRFFLDSICRYLDPRRIVTTELFLRGPEYVGLWLSVGIDAVPGESIATVRERVKAQLLRVLSPLPLDVQPPPPPGADLAPDPSSYPHSATGWPLQTAVAKAELTAFATRVPGVRVVRDVLLASGADSDTGQVEMEDLQLPRVAGISVVVGGDPTPLDQIRGSAPDAAAPTGSVPVPSIPEAC